MIRGTTPTHTFELPFDVSLISDLRLSYAQGDEVIITKKMEDVTLSEQTVTVRLTQEDTLKFDPTKGILQIQLKVLTTDGDVLSSEIIQENVWQALNNEVLT